MKFILYFSIAILFAVQAQSQQSYLVVSSYGKNIYNGLPIRVGSNIALNKKTNVLIVDQYCALSDSKTKTGHEFTRSGTYNLDSLKNVKQPTGAYEKLAGYIISNAIADNTGRNIKSAGVEMSINPSVVIFPKISKIADSSTRTYWTVNTSFLNVNKQKDSIVYTLNVYNKQFDTLFVKKTNKESLYIDYRSFLKKDSIFYWTITAHVSTTTGTKHIHSNVGTLIFSNEHVKNELMSNIDTTSGTYVYDVIHRIDFALRNGYYNKMVQYVHVLDNYLRLTDSVSYSSSTGRNIIDYTLQNILDYDEIDRERILKLLYVNKQ